MEINRENPIEQKSYGTVSLLQGDEHFVNRILSKDCSKGFSVRFYYPNVGVVPFQWETQPGITKNLPEHESIPPLSREMEINRENPIEQKSYGTVSLLQGDEHFVNRILSKDCSKGFSVRFYYPNVGVVPFQWETQPGITKNLPEHESIPPLSPPPTVPSLGFARPCIPPAKASIPTRVLKKIKRSIRGKKNQTELVKEDAYATNNGLGGVEKLEFWSSDCDSFSSPAGNSSSFSSCSSSSSSLSLFNPCHDSLMPSSKSQVPVSVKGRDGRF